MTTTNDTPTRGELNETIDRLQARLEVKQRHLEYADQERCRLEESLRDTRRQLEQYHAENVLLTLRVAELEAATCQNCEGLTRIAFKTERACERQQQRVACLETEIEEHLNATAAERIDLIEALGWCPVYALPGGSLIGLIEHRMAELRELRARPWWRRWFSRS